MAVLTNSVEAAKVGSLRSVAAAATSADLRESESDNEDALQGLGQVCALVSVLFGGCGVLLDPWIRRT